MKHCFIINPYAGKGKRTEELNGKIREVCKAAGVDFEIYMTVGEGDATEYVVKTARSHSDEELRFYACGGDGTLCEVVCGVMRLDDPGAVSVGLIPTGTGNDFVRNFTAPENFFAIQAQLEGEEMPIDLLRCNDMYAVNMVNIGFDCEVVCKTADLKKKKWLPSKSAYVAGLVATLAKKPGVKLTLAIDDRKPIHKEYLLTTYAMGGYCGGGFHSNPNACLDDGWIDCLVVRDISRTKFVSLVGSYKKGTHMVPKYERLLRGIKAKHVEMYFDAPTHISVDGELIVAEHLELTVLPKALRFSIPRGSAYQRDAEALAEEEATV